MVVVGSGLAGLACAGRLQQKGLKPLILEASDGVGGRVRSDVHEEGYILDRGFQVRGCLPLSPYLVAGKG